MQGSTEQYVRGIPVPNKFNRNSLYGRMRHHSESGSHTLACSHKGTRNVKGVRNLAKEISENETIQMEPTEAEIEYSTSKPLEDEIEENETIKIEPTEPEIEYSTSKPLEDEIEENETIKIEPTEAEIEKLEEEKVLNYIEKLKPKFPWLQVSEGKTFCKVRNIKGQVCQ